jgi:hypothetical protein
MSETRKKLVVLVISALFVVGAMAETAAGQRENDMPPPSQHRAAANAREGRPKGC